LGGEIILLNYCKCLQINSTFFQGITARLRSETTLPLKWIVARVQIGTAIGATSVPHHLAQEPRLTQNRKSPRTMRPARIPIYSLTPRLISAFPPFAPPPISAFQRLASAFSRVSAFPLSTFPFHLLPFRRTITRVFVMGGTSAQLPTGQVSLLGHHPSPRPAAAYAPLH
jgi:hypothetical protein